MNLREMRQGHLETGGGVGVGGEDPRSLRDKQKTREGFETWQKKPQL